MNTAVIQNDTAVTTKKDNKGFSLVELIIVITIMAVLTAIMAPQFLKYVERSRVARDATNISTVVRAVQTSLADEATYKAVAKTTGNFTIKYATSGADGTLTVAGSLNAAGDIVMAKELASVLGAGDTTTAVVTTKSPLVSQLYKDGATITVTFDANYSVKVTWTNP